VFLGVEIKVRSSRETALGCISVPVDLSGAETLCVNQLPTEMEAVCLREPSFLAG
jgi:hypothetical protein